MADLTPEQRRNIARSLAVANRKKGATARPRKALLLAEGVEANYEDVPYGDRDSEGVLQQRPSQGWGPASEPLEKDVSQFLDRAIALNRKGFKGSAGQLAQAVQRSAFPDRYDQRSAQVDALLARGGTQAGGGGRGATRTVGGVDNRAARGAAIAQFLGSKNSDPVDFAMAIRAARDIPGTPATQARAASRSGGGGASKLVSRADAIDKQRLPYKWGGGHGGKVNAYQAEPLDCSGAVSAVLGINPRVSGQFQSFGKPGDGGNRGVTIAANGKHVLMKIDGHWFGTSQSNPGGGAGWIPQSQVSPEYLKGFTLRHA